MKTVAMSSRDIGGEVLERSGGICYEVCRKDGVRNGRKWGGSVELPSPLWKWKGRLYLRLLHQGGEIGFNSDYSRGEWGLQPKSSTRGHGQKTVESGHHC